jgi:hypothetical protein
VNAGEAVPKPSRNTRIAFIIAALLLLVALCLHALIWYRTGVIDWPAAANMGGLLVLMGTGIYDPPRGVLRLALTVIGLALIVPGAYFLLMR